MGKKIALIVFGVLVLGFVVYYFYASFIYSKGVRAGLLYKFSEKGYVFKTYEGELNLGGVNTAPNAGLMNNIWTFSVKDQAVADELMGMEGKYVQLKYNEVNKPFFWQGESPYFVTDVSEVEK